MEAKNKKLKIINLWKDEENELMTVKNKKTSGKYFRELHTECKICGVLINHGTICKSCARLWWYSKSSPEELSRRMEAIPKKEKKILTRCMKCGSIDFYLVPRIRISESPLHTILECAICQKRYRLRTWSPHKLLNITEKRLVLRISKPGPEPPTLQRRLRPIG